MVSNESLPSSKTLTLESVKSQFAQWRATRVKGSKISKSLWDAAVHLTKSYDYHQIASELNINPSRLRKRMGEPFDQDSSLSASSHFIKASVPPLFSSSSPSDSPSLEQKILYPRIYTGSIELIRPDGTILKASGLDNKTLFSLIQGFFSQ